ncbi:ras and Rab interactor 1 [Puma concolor]|uniref:Ras and Rab interactor 1 n=1 Tax=Puma concolor TaxID=9696 RepID=A0A6P6H676_PUMCO|nr:ras and Rab interactor 1 [Puma concolor]
METPGEPEAGPLGAPSLSNFAPGHPEREKPAQDPLYDVPGASGGPAGGPQRPGRTVSLRERLLRTRPVWLQLRANAAAALHVLRTEPPGTFLVRKSNTRGCQALCVRLPEASGPSFVSSHYIQESPGGVSLEGSELTFPDLVQLICAYCHTRDILLLPLQLPRAICQAATHKELEAISHLGIEFWSSSLNTKAQPGLSEGPLLPRLKPRSPQELDQGTGAALCFFNPLFPGDLGPTKREKFKRSFKVRVSTETSSPLSPPAMPPPPVPVLPGAAPNQTERLPPHQLLRRESSVGYRVPGSASPSLPPLPSLQEVDCGSPSSSEEEGAPGSRGSPATSPRLGRRRRRPLLRSMSSAFCSLLAPERQVGRAATALVEDRHTAVGQLVQDLLTQVRAGPEPRELQGVREALSRARAMLSAELGPEKLLPPERLGEGAGADAFLPLLSLVLAQCDLPELLLEAEYMSELLEPTLLTGEGGYYLTSLSASLALLSGLDQAHMLPLSPSQELQRSLSLWEQRRLPATHSFQHLLRVAYQDPSSGCTSKTLAVPPGASVATLNQLCATKFRVTQPDTFGLFLYREQGYHCLSPGALVHRLPTTGYLVYRKAERPDTHGAAPGATTERDSGELEAGGREEEEGGRGDGIIEVKAGPGDSRGESETTAERVQGSVGQARGGPAPPGGPEAEGSRAAEE